MNRTWKRWGRRSSGLALGPLWIGGWSWWRFVWRSHPRVGLFRKRYKGVYNPRRWGGYVLGIEFGDRG